MTQPQWETVSLPQNADLPPFLKWGDIAGQEIVGAVLEFTATGGKDYDGNPSPRIEILLTQAGYNIVDGRQVQLQPGDRITWQGNTPIRLANGLKEANPARGDLIRLSHEGTYRTEKGTGKDIQIQIARGSGVQYLQQQPQPATQSVSQQPQAAPPF